VRFTAEVLGATQAATPGKGAYVLILQRNGGNVRRMTIAHSHQRFSLRPSGPGRWGLVLMHGGATADVGTPIWVTG
jgi:hypothetical protein